MIQATLPRPRPRPALVRGLATRFALIITDPRLSAALYVSCTDDTIDVHYPETRIRCRLRRLAGGGRLLCSLHVTHLAPDGSTEGHHHMDLTLAGALGSDAQREAVLHQLHAYHCAAAASRVRVATRVLRPARPLHHVTHHGFAAVA
ncbi:hypothetical protein [Streptomyces sp. ODS05-4]|uniref:hypothetical protein n=1 Tax=Streptomyces sp. ODS05-4 TaxID=2944939 RepID=UPI00210D9AAE|nr:hypothetical protein [Streptomyces sp. ODS05-4]